MPENSPSVNTISNSAKLLGTYMKATGITCAKTIAQALDIPVRTIQRLKLEYATGDVAEVNANSANDATGGAANCANSATDGVTAGADKKERSPTPPKEKTTSPRTTVETYNTPQPREGALCWDLKELSEKLRDAGGACLDPNAGDLQVMSTPIGWMLDGADLDIDILPTLRAASINKRGAMIRSWNYFDKQVARAKANRTRKLEHVEPANVVPIRNGREFKGMAAIERLKAQAAGGAA